MIVRGRIDTWTLLFALRGSIVPHIAARLVFLAVVALAVCLVAHRYSTVMPDFSAMPFTLIGIALSIFMSFRNNACYDRWWEARKLWGQLLIEVRSFARQVAHLDPVRREPLLLGLCAFAHGLAARLHDGDEAEAIARWHDSKNGAASPNPTDAVLRDLGLQCVELTRSGCIDSIHYSVLELRLTSLSAIQAGCERIKTTPLPFAYSLMLHRTATIFCLLLPFALVGGLGWWMPIPVLVVAYTFFGLDALGDQLEDPFGDDPNDLPLQALCRVVEREMLAALGRTDLPPMLLPVRSVLV
jgi:putative membrane protein